jgi:hypothetical protein
MVNETRDRKEQRRNTRHCPETQKAPPTDQEMADHGAFIAKMGMPMGIRHLQGFMTRFLPGFSAITRYAGPQGRVTVLTAVLLRQNRVSAVNRGIGGVPYDTESAV